MVEKQTEINIPKVSFRGEDKKMLERIIKFKKGTIRIVIFSIVGFVMGWFGYTYKTDPFLVTKVIFAIPYKLSEVIYTKMIGTGNVTSVIYLFGIENEFFQQSAIATFLAERFTPVILGGALYGSGAYFTGDKRVFTIKRYIKFVSIWITIILLFIGNVYGINAKAVYDNNHLKNVECFYLTSTNQAEKISDVEISNKLKRAFRNELQLHSSIEREYHNEIPIQIIFAQDTRFMIATVNYERGYLITQNGRKYDISDEFAGYVKEYYIKGRLIGIRNANSK